MPRKLARIISNVPAALSLVLTAASVLLGAASVIVWAQTNRTPRCWGRQDDGVIKTCRFERGRFTYRRMPDYPLPMEELGFDWQPIACDPLATRPRGTGWTGALGFGREEGTEFIAPAGVAAPGDHFSPLTYTVVEQWMPFWPVSLAAAILPSCRLATYLRRRRRRSGNRCPACGYDLRATPRQCPECGRECRAAVERKGEPVG